MIAPPSPVRLIGLLAILALGACGLIPSQPPAIDYAPVIYTAPAAPIAPDPEPTKGAPARLTPAKPGQGKPGQARPPSGSGPVIAPIAFPAPPPPMTMIAPSTRRSSLPLPAAMIEPTVVPVPVYAPPVYGPVPPPAVTKPTVTKPRPAKPPR